MVPVRESRKLSRNAVIFREKETPEFVYRLESGMVKIIRRLRKDDVLIRVVRKGEYFDERALFDQAPRRVSAVAVCDCEITPLAIEDLPHSGDTWRAIMAQAVRRAEEAEERAGRLARFKVEARLAHFLADFADSCCPTDGVPLSQRELADMIGATRESTCAALKRLEARGLVRPGRAKVALRSPEKLRRL